MRKRERCFLWSFYQSGGGSHAALREPSIFNRKLLTLAIRSHCGLSTFTAATARMPRSAPAWSGCACGLLRAPPMRALDRSSDQCRGTLAARTVRASFETNQGIAKCCDKRCHSIGGFQHRQMSCAFEHLHAGLRDTREQFDPEPYRRVNTVQLPHNDQGRYIDIWWIAAKRASLEVNRAGYPRSPARDLPR